MYKPVPRQGYFAMEVFQNFSYAHRVEDETNIKIAARFSMKTGRFVLGEIVGAGALARPHILKCCAVYR
jgi:hypothetical protein